MSDDTDSSAYYTDCESIASDIWDRIKEEGGDASDMIHEDVDGSQWVIYTYRALKVLEHSRNDDAAFEDMGDDALSGCTSCAEVYTRLAYYAMKRDVEEAYQEIVGEKGEPTGEEG